MSSSQGYLDTHRALYQAIYHIFCSATGPTLWLIHGLKSGFNNQLYILNKVAQI